jgi:hypothetical protein
MPVFPEPGEEDAEERRYRMGDVESQLRIAQLVKTKSTLPD